MSCEARRPTGRHDARDHAFQVASWRPGETTYEMAGPDGRRLLALRWAPDIRGQDERQGDDPDIGLLRAADGGEPPDAATVAAFNAWRDEVHAGQRERRAASGAQALAAFDRMPGPTPATPGEWADGIGWVRSVDGNVTGAAGTKVDAAGDTPEGPRRGGRQVPTADDGRPMEPSTNQQDDKEAPA